VSVAAGLIVLVGRIIFAIYFGTISGVAHIRGSQGMEQYAKGSGFPVPAIAGWPAGVWLIASAISLALGIWPDIGALMIAAFLVIAAMYFHRRFASRSRAPCSTSEPTDRVLMDSAPTPKLPRRASWR
jgi:uncharacterized membrane protein YphA (DoxX/SURF4 family)